MNKIRDYGFVVKTKFIVLLWDKILGMKLHEHYSVPIHKGDTGGQIIANAVLRHGRRKK